MKLRSVTLVSSLFLLAMTGLALPARASLIDIDVNGVLGPLLGGTDPIGLAGSSFSLFGTIDSGATPVGIVGDSATYNIPGTLQIMVANLALTGYNATLTLTAPPSGSDVLAVDFTVTAANFTPDVAASLLLPPGTLTGTGIQTFSATVSQPDSSFSYLLPGTSYNYLGMLGVTGTVSLSEETPSGVPEPGTIGLLAGGLVAFGCGMTLRRKRQL
jgi:hypothetical protein